jgi:tRNA threonylcarbamoyladenosine biosynthesis protein TsaE
MRNLKLISSSLEETNLLAKELGATLKQGDIVAFFGELGSGKTTFLKSLVGGLNAISPDDIHSPTFTYLHIYPGDIPVYHFDLYRLNNATDFTALGFHEFFEADGICCIEWSEKIELLLPSSTIKVKLSHVNETSRAIEVFS